MNITESLEMTTWTAEELKHAMQPEQIKKVRIICRITTIIFFFSFLLAFFGGGIYLKEIGIIGEETLLFKVLGFVVFVALMFLLWFPIKYFTIVLSAKLRIMPKRLARITLEKWRQRIWEVSAALGAGIGAGM